MTSNETSPKQKDTSYGCLLFLGGIDSKNQLLLLLHNQGHWGFPKGHKDGKETPTQAAARELQEETGITPEQIHKEPQFIDRYSFQRNGINYQKTVTYFLAVTRSGRVDIDENEIKDYKWTFIDEVEELIIDGAKSPVLLQLREYLEDQ